AADRMKAGKPHAVPLSDQARSILSTLRRGRDDELIFPLSNMAMLTLLQRRMGLSITVHGLRSCFSDWTAERTASSSAVRQMALEHVVKNKSEAAYRRGDLFDKRARLMTDWARFCTSPMASGEVVALRA